MKLTAVRIPESWEQLLNRQGAMPIRCFMPMSMFRQAKDIIRHSAILKKQTISVFISPHLTAICISLPNQLLLDSCQEILFCFGIQDFWKQQIARTNPYQDKKVIKLIAYICL